MIRADLVAEDRAEPDADRAPERDAAERAEHEQRHVWSPLRTKWMPRPVMIA